MKTFKSRTTGRKVLASCVILAMLACTKGDDPLITYEGRVFLYVGPYIPNIGLHVDEANLSPAVGITMRLYRPGPCGFGHCSSGIALDELAVTDTEGNYSFRVRSQLENGYYVSAEFPENVEYSGSRGFKKELVDKVIFSDIILVDNQ